MEREEMIGLIAVVLCLTTALWLAIRNGHDLGVQPLRWVDVGQHMVTHAPLLEAP